MSSALYRILQHHRCKSARGTYRQQLMFYSVRSEPSLICIYAPLVRCYLTTCMPRQYNNSAKPDTERLTGSHDSPPCRHRHSKLTVRSYMFRRKHRDIRIIYKVLKDSKSVTDAMAWLRRNYPEAFRRDGE